MEEEKLMTEEYVYYIYNISLSCINVCNINIINNLHHVYVSTIMSKSDITIIMKEKNIEKKNKATIYYVSIM
jgi:hypothetical protein